MILPDVQLLIFAFWLGAALSVCFAVLECVRLTFRVHKFTVFIADILFCLFCTGCTFLLALAGTNGFLRLYWFAFGSKAHHHTPYAYANSLQARQ